MAACPSLPLYMRGIINNFLIYKHYEKFNCYLHTVQCNDVMASS